MKCNAHMDGETPMFLRYDTCDDCDEIRKYRVREAGKRKARVTRANRATAQINSLPATAVVRSFHASKLPKSDLWYRAPQRKARK